MIINNKEYSIEFLKSRLIIEKKINRLTSSAISMICWQSARDLRIINYMVKDYNDIHSKK